MKNAWRCINENSDVEEEEEIDDTKEIQIEEALKLYQTALKHHSEGPASYPLAADAYKALFESEIFKYAESLSEFKRHELYGDTLVFDTILEDLDEYDPSPGQPTGANESATNTLAQILHLSYKNHGQFMLQSMQHWISVHGPGPQTEASAQILGALNHFAEALDKDDTDLDLWLRTASVAALMGSPRITRFCLEAVLDGDDDLLNSVMRLPGLEEGFAGQQLVELVHKLEDNVSLMEAPLSMMRRKKLSEILKKRLNPYPFAPLPSEVAQPTPLAVAVVKPASRLPLNYSKWTWAGVAEALVMGWQAEQGGMFESQPGSSIVINVPAEVQEVDSNQPDSTAVGEEVPAQTAETPAAAVPVAEASEAPQKDDQDVEMQDQDTGAEETNRKTSEQPQETPQAPSRKRSTDSAGLPETAEGGRSRSKRIRARDSIVADPGTSAEAARPDLAKQLEEQLAPFIEADHMLYQIMNDIYDRFGIEAMGSPEELRDIITGKRSEDESCDNRDKAARDLFTALTSGGPEVARGWTVGTSLDLGASCDPGLSNFLGFSKTTQLHSQSLPYLMDQQLTKFASTINGEWLTLQEVAFAWLEAVLGPGYFPCPSDTPYESTSSYLQYRWLEDLKRQLVQMLINFDEYFTEQFLERIAKIDAAILDCRANSVEYIPSEWDMAQFEMIETIFELHLDVYSLIRRPQSGVPMVTQISQKDRLLRWTSLARDAMQLRTDCLSTAKMDNLSLRHIWASVFLMLATDDIPPDFVLASFHELKKIFASVGGPLIEVHNNAIMPELSVAAVDRELARISMKDFFLKVFDQENTDPVSVIHNLEPILEPVQASAQEPDQEDDQHDSGSSTTLSHAPDAVSEPHMSRSPSQEMRKFLATAELELILNLWQRLREAYEAIEYPAKVVACYLRSLETMVTFVKSSKFNEHPPAARQIKISRILRQIDDILVKVVAITKSDKNAFDCLPYDQLQVSMQVLADLLRILTAVNMQEDMVRVGQIPAPRFEGFHHTAYPSIITRIHDMQMRAWILQYYLLKEGLQQNQNSFLTPTEDKFEFLRHVHYATGVRGFCHAAGRTFLRLAKDELLLLDDVIDGNTRDNEVAQVLYDLYGLKLFVKGTDCLDFASSPEPLDKKTSFQMLSFVLSQARKIDSKDLPKQADFKISIDKIHGSLGRLKTNEDLSLNRKIVNNYLKSPINPVSLFESLKGVGSLSTKIIPAETAVAVSKGWYFLMGNIHLNKFCGVKRLNAGPTEDLNYAQTFFMHDLDVSIDRWETWYRLAQVNDSQLAECVTWTAERLNSNSMDLINNQRHSIHSYAMATACAVRNADAAPQTLAKLSNMYCDFGTRVYSSSREPFCMNAFDMKDSEKRVFSSHLTQKVYEESPFQAMRPYAAWKLASVLFKRAIRGKPDNWWSHYMLAKCYWKMYTGRENEEAYRAQIAAQRGEDPIPVKAVTAEVVVAAIVNAIQAVPEKRERGREPVLEPHYKLLTIVNKLVQRKDIDYEEGEALLQNTSYAQGIRGPDSFDDWERYILSVLKVLRNVDKSSWHHRMIIRHAHILYDETRDVMVARAAKHELMQQMFTKTMMVQVWRCENERPGRHFVYTSRYVRFMAQLLDQTDDKVNMDLLLKRIRKRNLDFWEHTKLWQDVCLQYLRMIRRIGQIPEGHEDAVFKSLNPEEFAILAARLEAWCQDPKTQHPALDALREVTELKRLNLGLMKAVVMDDLIGDSYAFLYGTIASTLPPLPSEQQQTPAASGGAFNATPVGNMQLDGSADTLPPPPFPPPAPVPGASGVLTVEAAPRARLKTIGRREIQRRAESCAVRPSAPAPSATPSTSMPIRSPRLTHPQVVIPSPEKRVDRDRESASKSPLKQSLEQSPEKAGDDEAPQPSAQDPSAQDEDEAEDPNEPDEPDEPKDTPSPSKQIHRENQLHVPSASGTTTLAPSVSVSNIGSSAPASIHSIQDDADDESDLSELDEDEVRGIQEENGIYDPVQQGRSRGSSGLA